MVVSIVVRVYVPAIDNDGRSNTSHGDVGEQDVFHEAAVAVFGRAGVNVVDVR